MSLPPLAAPPFAVEQWRDYAIQLTYAGQQAIVSLLEELRMSMDDLKTSMDRAEASQAAATAAARREIKQVLDAVNALGAAPTVQDMQAFKARLEQHASNLDSLTAELGTDDPAVPPPTPPPTP